MTGIDETRAHEYPALMSHARELGRTAQLCWTGAAVTAAVLLGSAIGGRHPGMLLPVEFCTAIGFYASARARHEGRLIEGYLQEFHEVEPDGEQWHTRLARLHALPGFQDHSDWLPLALANSLTLVAVVCGWLFSANAAHGELMAGLVTMTGVGFSVHSIVQNMQLDRAQTASGWSQLNTGLHAVSPPTQRVGNSR